MKDYKEQIDKLDWIIKNWDMIKRDPKKAKRFFARIWVKDELIVRFGLCHACRFINVEFDEEFEMFTSFRKFSGSWTYPLDGCENYDEKTNFAKTPERLELAIHCKKFLEILCE